MEPRIIVREVFPQRDRSIAPLIIDMDRACLPNDYRAPVADPSTLWWIAYGGPDPCAYAGLSVSETSAVMVCSGVLMPWRGLGIQKKLIKARLKRAKSLGLELVTTHTVYWNSPSMNSLISCGFKIASSFATENGQFHNWEYRIK